MENICIESKPPGRVKKGRKMYQPKILSITALPNDYFNLDNSSGSGRNNERENLVQNKCNFCGGTNHYADECFQKKKKGYKKYRTSCASYRQRTDRKPRKMFRWWSVDNIITRCPRPTKDN